MPNSPSGFFVPRPLSRSQVRDVDRLALEEYGMSGLVLMENAGRNAAELLRSLGIGGPVAICCGKGNNGGDGFVIARHLENVGVEVRVLLSFPAEVLTGDAATNLQILHRAGMLIVPPSSWEKAMADVDWIVDALLGTGTQGTLREPFLSRIAAINSLKRKVFAVDLPSGLDCDTGESLGDCVRANHTATFVARKIGFDHPQATAFTGQVHVIDIGAPRTLLQQL